MNNTYEVETCIVVNQKEYENLKKRSLNEDDIISHEQCRNCGHGFNVQFGSCYNIKCEQYLRNNKRLFTAGDEYSIPAIKRIKLSSKEASDMEDNLKNYEKITKL